MLKYRKRKLVIPDAYVRGIEHLARHTEYGFRYVTVYGTIDVIDHHAPLQEFERNVSATNLALLYIARYGTTGDDTLVAINHTDADAIMAAATVTGVFGRLEANAPAVLIAETIDALGVFGEAAIDADHTGRENSIADLLQSFKFERDVGLSLRSLERLLTGRPLESRARELLDIRLAEREKAKEVVRAGRVKYCGNVAYVVLDRNVDLAFWPALLPEAWVILTYAKRREGCFVARTRLGMEGFGKISLNHLGINGFDPEWGGRFNAGSDRRGEGTALTVEEYASLLDQQVQRCRQAEQN